MFSRLFEVECISILEISEIQFSHRFIEIIRTEIIEIGSGIKLFFFTEGSLDIFSIIFYLREEFTADCELTRECFEEKRSEIMRESLAEFIIFPTDTLCEREEHADSLFSISGFSLHDGRHSP